MNTYMITRCEMSMDYVFDDTPEYHVTRVSEAYLTALLDLHAEAAKLTTAGLAKVSINDERSRYVTADALHAALKGLSPELVDDILEQADNDQTVLVALEDEPEGVEVFARYITFFLPGDQPIFEAQLDDDSDTQVFTHNVDIHDLLAQLTGG